MAGLSHLRDVYEKRGKEFLENLLNKTVIINEKADGAYLGAKKNAGSNTFNFFKKDSKIGYADRVLNRYYESGIRYFESIDGNTVTAIPDNLMFGMDYDPSKNMPLTLTHIKVLNENFQQVGLIQDRDQLTKWAQNLGVNPPSIIFQGKLDDEQKAKILEFVYTPLKELSEKFKTVSFTKHILSILNPIVEESSDAPEPSLEELVFRFYESENDSSESIVLAKLVDPVFYDQAKSIPTQKVQKRSDDYIWIIVIDLMNFIEGYRLSELRSFTISGSNDEERYISLINHLFSAFISEYGEKYRDLEIRVPDFLTRPEFDVNLDLVKDHRVVEIINQNPNFKEIYRVFVNIFRKKKMKISSPLFTDSMIANLFAQINKLDKVAQGDQVYENYFPTFNEFVGTDDEPGYFETFDQDPSKKTKVQRVNLLVSEFQPAHNGHIKNAKTLKEKNGLPVLLVGVHPGKTSKKFPFKKETVNNSLSKIAAVDGSTFAGHIMIDNSNIESILKGIKPGFEPVMIAASPSRVRDLALQFELAKKRSRNLNIKRDTSLIELPTHGVEESLIDSVRGKDFAKFKESTPASIHSEFYNFNKDISESINEGHVEPIQINESIQIDTEIEPIIKFENISK